MEATGMGFSAPDYVRAFQRISRHLTLRHRAILVMHYRAANHTATSGELAQEIGYQSRQPLNKSLRHVAELLCSELDVHISDPLLVLVSAEQEPGNEPRMTLLPAVVAALDALNWAGGLG